ncbi:hypothetical protein [Variovorax sp. LT1R16]
MYLPVQVVGAFNHAGLELVALAVDVEGADEADFLEQFEFAGENFVATGS